MTWPGVYDAAGRMATTGTLVIAIRPARLAFYLESSDAEVNKKLSLPRNRLSAGVLCCSYYFCGCELGGQFNLSLGCFSQSRLRLNKSGRTGLHQC